MFPGGHDGLQKFLKVEARETKAQLSVRLLEIPGEDALRELVY